jgi:hypothetical protein
MKKEFLAAGFWLPFSAYASLEALWIRVLKIPYFALFPLIILFSIIGAYTTAGNIGDVFIVILFAVAGYFMKKFGYEPAPLVLGFVLGPLRVAHLQSSCPHQQIRRRAGGLVRVGAGIGHHQYDLAGDEIASSSCHDAFNRFHFV